MATKPTADITRAATSDLLRHFTLLPSMLAASHFGTAGAPARVSRGHVSPPTKARGRTGGAMRVKRRGAHESSVLGARRASVLGGVFEHVPFGSGRRAVRPVERVWRGRS